MMKMKMVMLLAGTLMLSACGMSSRGTESVGQIKRVIGRTPILCPDYSTIDLSLGVMRNGVGSMSTTDIIVTVPKDLLANAKQISASGSLVNVTYDVRRYSLCEERRIATKIEAVK